MWASRQSEKSRAKKLAFLRRISTRSAGTIWSTSGVSSFKRVAAHMEFERCWGIMPLALSGIWATIEGTIFRTLGTESFNWAAAHKVLDKCCGIMSLARTEIRGTISRTISNTSGTTPFNCTQAHKLFDKSCAFMPSAFSLIDLTNAINKPLGAPKPANRCPKLQRTFATPRGSSWPFRVISCTRAASRGNTGLAFSLGVRPLPFFHVARLWYAAEAWKWLKTGPSTTPSKRPSSSAADFACFILDVNFRAAASLWEPSEALSLSLTFIVTRPRGWCHLAAVTKGSSSRIPLPSFWLNPYQKDWSAQ